MANGTDPERFTVKEILTNFIQPTLENIEKKLDAKADAIEVERLENRVELLAKATAELPATINKVNSLEERFTSPEQIANMISKGLQDAKARGWTTRERVLGGVVAITTLLTFIINLIIKF